MNSRAATPRGRVDRTHRNPEFARAPDRFMTIPPVAHGAFRPCLATHEPANLRGVARASHYYGAGFANTRDLRCPLLCDGQRSCYCLRPVPSHLHPLTVFIAPRALRQPDTPRKATPRAPPATAEFVATRSTPSNVRAIVRAISYDRQAPPTHALRSPRWPDTTPATARDNPLPTQSPQTA